MAEALEEPFALEELEISQIEECASVSNFDNINYDLFLSGLLFARKRQKLLSCKSLNQYYSSVCHNGNSYICLNNRRAPGLKQPRPAAETKKPIFFHRQWWRETAKAVAGSSLVSGKYHENISNCCHGKRIWSQNSPCFIFTCLTDGKIGALPVIIHLIGVYSQSRV